ncbi:fungal hydrophobin-domain-containing protein [Panaeolus papilionaceus]|nr:fungal hydrophobin-domain-containing protein [Panaeolus papilionaceus]
MFKNAASFSVLALPILAAATAVELDARQSGNCNTGDIQCCNNTFSNTATTLASLSSLLGISLPSISGLIGLACSPISVLGAGGNSCSAQPVCCTNNSFNGLVSLGCSPINLNL